MSVDITLFKFALANQRFWPVAMNQDVGLARRVGIVRLGYESSRVVLGQFNLANMFSLSHIMIEVN